MKQHPTRQHPWIGRTVCVPQENHGELHPGIVTNVTPQGELVIRLHQGGVLTLPADYITTAA